MFDNIGGKIKTLAKVVCWTGIIACIITGIVLMATDEELVLAGILTAAGGSLLSWVSSFVLYGFGQLVENSDVIVSQNNKLINHKVEKQDQNLSQKEFTNDGTPSKPTESPHKWRCVSCGEMVSSNPCPHCGSNITVRKLATPNPDKIVCPMCGFEQPSNRTCCWHCSTKFDNSNK